MYIYVNVFLYICIYAYVYIHVQTYASKSIHIYICMHIYLRYTYMYSYRSCQFKSAVLAGHLGHLASELQVCELPGFAGSPGLVPKAPWQLSRKVICTGPKRDLPTDSRGVYEATHLEPV